MALTVSISVSKSYGAPVGVSVSAEILTTQVGVASALSSDMPELIVDEPCCMGDESATAPSPTACSSGDCHYLVPEAMHRFVHGTTSDSYTTYRAVERLFKVELLRPPIS